MIALRAAAGLFSYMGQDRIFKCTMQDPTQYNLIDICDWKLESDTSEYSTESAYIYVGEQPPAVRATLQGHKVLACLLALAYAHHWQEMLAGVL
jgi:hypothetical protein